MNGFEFKNVANKPTIYIYEDIGESWFAEDPLTAKRFADELESLGKVKEINVRINSAGGSVFDARAIASLLRDNPAKITVDIDGVCASAATYIACVGDECRIAEDGIYMIHNPWGVCVGDASDMAKTAESLNTIRDGMVKIYAKRSGKEEKDIVKLIDAETWMSAQEAKDNGFVDSISETSMKLAASASRSKLSNLTTPFRNVPESFKDRVKFDGGSAPSTETRFDERLKRMVVPADSFRKREADEARAMVEKMKAKVKP